MCQVKVSFPSPQGKGKGKDKILAQEIISYVIDLSRKRRSARLDLHISRPCEPQGHSTPVSPHRQTPVLVLPQAAQGLQVPGCQRPKTAMQEEQLLVMIVDGHSETREWLASNSPSGLPAINGYQWLSISARLVVLRYSIHYFTVLAIEDAPEPQLACATS